MKFFLYGLTGLLLLLDLLEVLEKLENKQCVTLSECMGDHSGQGSQEKGKYLILNASYCKKILLP